MRTCVRPIAAAALTLLGACGSITDPSGSEALFARKPPKPPPPPKPAILFVHGFNSSANVWTTMIGRFRQDGWAASQLVAFSYNTAASNATTATIIKQKVDSIRGSTGTPVVIIGHSMGTMSARHYTKNLGGGEMVSGVVSLAGANHGTSTAAACAFLVVSCREMMPGSAFLTALNATDETWGSARYGAWWSPCDEVINPRESALLAGGADNTQTACLQHSQLHQDATVYAQVRAWVSQPPAATILAAVR